jgi:hypothetical protein
MPQKNTENAKEKTRKKVRIRSRKSNRTAQRGRVGALFALNATLLTGGSFPKTAEKPSPFLVANISELFVRLSLLLRHGPAREKDGTRPGGLPPFLSGPLRQPQDPEWFHNAHHPEPVERQPKHLEMVRCRSGSPCHPLTLSPVPTFRHPYLHVSQGQVGFGWIYLDSAISTPLRHP